MRYEEILQAAQTSQLLILNYETWVLIVNVSGNNK